MTQLAAPVTAVPASVRHTPIDDTFGIATGTALASFGLFLLATSGAVTGGTAGVGLLLARITGAPYEWLYLAAGLPFVLLAVTRKGWNFTLRSAVAVTLVAVLARQHDRAFTLTHLDPLYASLFGNLLVGVGILILFRHGSSLGGFNVVALLAQERLGWRAGYVQLALDGTVIAISAFFAPWHVVVVSIAGAVVLNLVLAVNHRPGRYVGA